MFDSKTTVFKAKANMSDSKKIIFEANTLDRKKIIFEAKRTRSTLKGHGNEPVFPMVLLKSARHGSLTLLFELFRFWQIWQI
jgi:hypothetical protein